MRYLCLLLFLCYQAPVKASDPKPTLVYIFDPLCGWCYLFTPVIEQIQQKYRDRLRFSVLSGGMIPASKAKPISFVREFVMSAQENRKDESGPTFGEPYLELVRKGTDTLCSEKPSFAFVAFREQRPEQSIAFVNALQKSHFEFGLSYSSNEVYTRLARQFQLDTVDFLRVLQSDSVQSIAKKEFEQVETAGINGFPTLLIQLDGKVEVVSEGCQTFAKIDRKLEKLLKSR